MTNYVPVPYPPASNLESTGSSVGAANTPVEQQPQTPSYPPFQQPPQCAYGWWVPEPPPFGPYFWPCLPPGYTLVPSISSSTDPTQLHQPQIPQPYPPQQQAGPSPMQPRQQTQAPPQSQSMQQPFQPQQQGVSLASAKTAGTLFPKTTPAP